tara:strand:+ start:14019 stop:14639 length:621 start_codon:yes stop_codon:yes gene_type:complete
MEGRKKQKSDVGTRQRILAAALEEFSLHGYSGARIDRITKQADANVRMIYHFFDNKKGLLDAVLAQIFNERQEALQKTPETIEDLLGDYFQGYSTDRHRVRLLEWEALENGTRLDNLNTVEERKISAKKRVEALARLQKDGQLPADIDPEMLYLFCVALTIYPLSFPQSVYVATGEDAYSDEFQKRYHTALQQLAGILKGSQTSGE